MTHPGPSDGGSDPDGLSLRLLWPQWQDAGTSSVREFAPRVPLRRRPARVCRGIGGLASHAAAA